MTTLTAPANAADLEAALNDVATVRELATDPAKHAAYIQAYTKNVNQADPTIAEQIREEREKTQLAFAAMIEQFGNSASENAKMFERLNLATNPRGGKIYNSNAPGSKLDEQKLFTNAADYFRATSHTNLAPEATAMRSKLREISNSFGSLVPADGGFLIPETMRAELLRVALESAIVRPRARTIPMESLRVPIPTIDSISNATNVYGGVTAFWTEEGAAMTESQATFGRVVLEAHKLTAYAEAPNELLADAYLSFTALIEQLFPEALAWFEDVAFLRGTGVGEPLGVLNAGNAATVTVSAEAGQAATTLVWENIVKMYARMIPSSLGRGVWLVNPDTFPQLATMALSVGTGGSAVWLNNGQDGPPATILGRPVVITEKAGTLGSLTDVSFIDFGYYLIGDRQSMTSMTSPHFRFNLDKTAIRFTERVDGRPWLQSAVTPNQGSNTLSPFVNLAAR